MNAIYLKAPWEEPFKDRNSQPSAFHLGNGESVNVPTMMQQHAFGYEARDGYRIVTIPYANGEIQFLILLPDATQGLEALEKKLTKELFAYCARVRNRELLLFLPKFKLEPPTISVGDELKAMGMRSAFDEPPGSANFDRITPRRPNDHLYISGIFHKTFLKLDEQGTEAAAASAVDETTGILERAKLEVHVDHPFLFAIQHRPSGACLFLGRIVDPR